MVTCKVRKCMKRKNLNDAGYCQDHVDNTQENNEANVPCKCGECKLDVSDDEGTKALCCDSRDCKVWYHLECTKMSEQLYELISEASKNQDSGVRWICPQCSKDDPAIKLVSQSIEEVKETVCNKLRHGTCPHGISGKTEYKGKVCDFFHPKLCKKFIRNGPGGRYGCKKSQDDCPFFHPRLCQKSVKFRKCLDRKCSRTHLKGTIRKEYLPSEPFPPQVSPSYAEQNQNDFQQQNVWKNQRGHFSKGGTSVNTSRNSYRYTGTASNTDQAFLDSPPPQAQQFAFLQAQVSRLEELITLVLKQSPSLPQAFNPPSQEIMRPQSQQYQKWSS